MRKNAFTVITRINPRPGDPIDRNYDIVVERMTRNFRHAAAAEKMSDHKLSRPRFWSSSATGNICRGAVFQGRFDLDFSAICRRERRNGGLLARARGKFNPIPTVDARARYDNRILVSRFVTLLPEGNIIPANPEAARLKGTRERQERNKGRERKRGRERERGSDKEKEREIIFVLSNFP